MQFIPIPIICIRFGYGNKSGLHYFIHNVYCNCTHDTYVCIIGSSDCVHPPTLNITCTAWSNVPLRNCFPFGSTDMETYKMGVRNKCVDG